MGPPSPLPRDRARLVLAGLLGLGLAAVAFGLARATPPWATAAAAEALANAREAGKPPPVASCVDLALWPALAVSAAVLAVLLATIRWWGGRSARPGLLPALARVPRTTLVALVAAAAVGAALRGPRLGQSFWNDEETTLQDYAWGEWKQGSDGSWKFRPVPWQDTVFYNRGGSNHVLNSVLTRLTLAAADAADGPQRGHFSEAVARSVPFAASLAAIFLIGWLLARAGLAPGGAVAAALILALHPWHLRYSVEIRGYSLMLAAMVGALACLVEALASGRRRWWAGFAACQSVFLLCFPGAVYFAVAMNAAVVAACLAMWHRQRATAPPPWPTLARLAAWTALSLLPVVVLMAPSLPQVAWYLAEGRRMIAFTAHWGWEKDFFTHLVAGVRPLDLAADESLATTVAMLPGRSVLVCLSVVALGGLVLAIVRRGRPALRLVLAALVAAPLLSYAHNRLADNPTMPWYLLFAVLAFAAGLGAVMPGRRGMVPTLSVAVLAIVFAWAVAPANLGLATVPRQPLREVATVLRGTAPTYGVLGDTRILTATFGTSAKRLRSYDPRIEVLRSPAGLDALLDRARRDQLPLRIAFCGRRLALTAPESPEDQLLVRRIEDPASGFRLIAEPQGLEELFSYHVWEATPGK